MYHCAEKRTAWDAETRLRWEERRGQERAEVFVPGRRESILKWERADVPRLGPRMLGAGQRRGAHWKELELLDTARQSLGALNRVGVLAHWSHSPQLSKLLHSDG